MGLYMTDNSENTAQGNTVDSSADIHRSEIISDLLEKGPVTSVRNEESAGDLDGPCFFFAGGGTGGHIYPAIAVAEQIRKLHPDSKLTFFCSGRTIDSHILKGSGYDYITLPASGLSANPVGMFRFISGFFKSRKSSHSVMSLQSRRAALISVGGFVSAGPVLAAKKLGIPIVIINVDYVPGKANRRLAKYADEIFVQFPETKKYFGRSQKKITVSGCPLRDNFDFPIPDNAVRDLDLDKNKKVLLIIGGSSGAQTLNNAMMLMFPALACFASSWQIVHITGKYNYQQVRAAYTNATVEHKIVDYYNNMADLYAASDLLIGRAGGVSIAEYAASGLPAICLPYPHHKDNHQYLNAKPLVEAGAALIVDDNSKDCVATSKKLLEAVLPLMKNEEKRNQMSAAAKKLAAPQPAGQIAQSVIEMLP